MRTTRSAGVKFKPSVYSAGISIMLFLMLIPARTFANQGGQIKKNNWYLSGSSGLAVLTKEVTKSFSALENEFRHHPGFTYDLSVTRTFGSRWESSIRLGVYSLTGESNIPDFSANGYHYAISQMKYRAPVEYLTQSTSASLLLRYHFNRNFWKNGNKIRFSPFFEAGAGINSFKSELRYQAAPAPEEPLLIFRKSDNQYPVGVAQFISGLGAKVGGYGEWNIIVLANAELVNYDCLDAVHNYSNGERNHTKGVVFRLTAGIAIPVLKSVKKDPYLPFRW